MTLDKRTIGKAAIIILVIVVVGWAVKRITGGNPLPDYVKKQIREKADVETGEVISMTVSEWQAAGCKDGNYKNPKTGKYTMRDTVKCYSCGAKIARLRSSDRPKTDAIPFSETNPIPKQPWWEKIKCPKCGKQAYNAPPP